MFNLLTDELPHNIEIDDYIYAISTGFKTILKAAAIMSGIGQPPKDKTNIAKTVEYYIDFNQKIDRVLHLIYGQRTHNPSKALEKAIKFIRFDGDNAEHEYGADEKTFVFTADAKYIYSAFLQQYGIDLTVTNLHWYKFKALLQSLKECKLTDVIYYRTVDLSDYKGKELTRMHKLKQMYSLDNKDGTKYNPSEILRDFLNQNNSL